MMTFDGLLWNLIVWLTINFAKCSDATTISTKPNIIVIMADDMGWNDVGFHGSNQIPTPNIDALGYNGIILHKFYTQSLCTPSRAAFLTGNYPIRSGMQGLPLKAGEDRFLPLLMATMPEQLKNLGYNTHLVGKWHLGASRKWYTPRARGFDSFYGYWNGFIGYFDYIAEQEEPKMEGFDLHKGYKTAKSVNGMYATKLFTKKSLKIIDQHDQSAPLFLVVSHLAAHTGRNGSELGVPDINRTNRKFSYIKDTVRRRYADVVNQLDKSVGKIVDKLQERDMLKNSIILYFSDNGAPTIGYYANKGSNWPFRGIKATNYEGGVRGTGVMYSPLFTKQGYVNRELIHITDFLPTFYAAAGGNLTDLGKIDGVNQWRTLSDNSTTNRKELLINIDEALNNSALIMKNGRYKLLNGSFVPEVYDKYFGESGRTSEEPPYNITNVLQSLTNLAIKKLVISRPLSELEINETRRQVDMENCRKSSPLVDCTGYCLFDLEQDPCETVNIIEKRTKIAEKMKTRLGRFWAALTPQTNKPADPAANPIYHGGNWVPWLDIKE